MVKKILTVTALSLLVASWAGSSYATEQILSFDSYIDVQEDSSLIVTETIRVRAEGKEIKRGIYRDFPTIYRKPDGKRHVVGFKVLSVERDGVPEDYHIKPLSNGKRVYFGNANRFLSTGHYTYTFMYQTNRQLGFFENHDELYWNVTGNDWAFAIASSSATVALPNGAAAHIIEQNGYTGYQGSRERAYAFSRPTNDTLKFTASRPLARNEGFTIHVSWPKGFVSPPSAFMNLQFFINDNIDTIKALACLIIVFGYYMAAWAYVGRDPKKGTIIPLFHPPKNMSPAAIRYLMNMRYDNKAFTAAIINMAVKGVIKITENTHESLGILIPKKYTLSKTGQNEEKLTRHERKILEKLIGSLNSITLENKSHMRISEAIRKHKGSLKREFNKIYFFANSGYFTGGLLLSIAMGYIVFGTMDVAGASIGWLFMIGILFVIMNFAFIHLLKAPTLKGRKMMDQIDGFKMFLTVTEKERLNMLNPPEKTPELFEKYLPFALALGVDQKWAEQFANVFKRLEEAGTPYNPYWYHGNYHHFNASSFSSNLASNFSTAVASSAVPPGSSGGGGFGGGGFSGGGGGGGGGGGW